MSRPKARKMYLRSYFDAFIRAGGEEDSIREVFLKVLRPEVEIFGHLALRLGEQIKMVLQHTVFASLATSVMALGVFVTGASLVIQTAKLLSGTVIALLHAWCWLCILFTSALFCSEKSSDLKSDKIDATVSDANEQGALPGKRPLPLIGDWAMAEVSTEPMHPEDYIPAGEGSDGFRKVLHSPKPHLWTFEDNEGVVWSPNAAYNADRSCFT